MNTRILEGHAEKQNIFKNIFANTIYSLGGNIRSALSSLGAGYSVKVIDYGSDVFVSVSYTNSMTGKTAGCNFLIKFTSKRGEGIIKANEARYRTISSVTDAISYINSKSSNLKNLTS